jgi:hypothetical protein
VLSLDRRAFLERAGAFTALIAFAPARALSSIAPRRQLLVVPVAGGYCTRHPGCHREGRFYVGGELAGERVAVERMGFGRVGIGVVGVDGHVDLR